MAETAALLASAGTLVGLLPLVWSACDRRAACGRFEGNDSPGIPVRQDFVDDITFLTLVARSVRAGATSAKAITDAPPPSPDVARAQSALREGAPLQQALDSGATALRTLAACVHHGVLSVDAIEHAVLLARNESQLRSDIRTALALTRRSALVLTSVPFVLLCLASLLSKSVREILVSPAAVAVVLVGTVINRAGLAWMSATARSVSTEHMRQDRLLSVASAIAAHLRAGGNMVSAFERLSPHDHGCAVVSSLLAQGESLRVSLDPLGPDLEPLVHVLTACHADGLPVAPAVDGLIDSVSAGRAAAVREMVAQLPARGTTPLVLLVLPSFLLLAVAPLALAVVHGLRFPTP